MSTPEQALWRAVLEQAYMDAELGGLGQAQGASLDCALARRYLRADSSHEAMDLGVVCEYADIPADRVILWARSHYPVAA